MYVFDRSAYEARVKWYREARFGMFLHWGLYSIPARGEWVRSIEEMPEESYMRYFEEFNPSDYNPRAWVKSAKEAGMKYIVLTAKHHDGFCLFDSQYTDFKSVNTPFARDAVAEFVEAVRAEGLKVGLYFTLIDWHHPDYPHYQDRYHPMRNHPECGNENRDFSRYLDYMHAQVRELCTNLSKTASSSPAGIPMPSSDTRTTTASRPSGKAPARTDTRIVRRPGAGKNQGDRVVADRAHEPSVTSNCRADWLG